MDCHGLPKKLQALQPTLVFVLLSHHNGLQYQVEPFFRQTSLIYAHLAPETDFELATLPRGPPIFRFGFQKKMPGLLKDGGITCAQRVGKNSRLSPSATKCASVYISLNFHEPQPVRLTVTVTLAKSKSFSGKDHLARVLSLVSRATAGPGSKLVIRWMLWVSTEELVKHFAAMSSSFSSLRPRNLGQGREPYVSVSSASVSSWNFNCWKPPTGSLEELVQGILGRREALIFLAQVMEGVQQHLLLSISPFPFKLNGLRHSWHIDLWISLHQVLQGLAVRLLPECGVRDDLAEAFHHCSQRSLQGVSLSMGELVQTYMYHRSCEYLVHAVGSRHFMGGWSPCSLN